MSWNGPERIASIKIPPTYYGTWMRLASGPLSKQENLLSLGKSLASRVKVLPRQHDSLVLARPIPRHFPAPKPCTSNFLASSNQNVSLVAVTSQSSPNPGTVVALLLSVNLN
jgi:hypothetical protein